MAFQTWNAPLPTAITARRSSRLERRQSRQAKGIFIRCRFPRRCEGQVTITTSLLKSRSLMLEGRGGRDEISAVTCQLGSNGRATDWTRASRDSGAAHLKTTSPEKKAIPISDGRLAQIPDMGSSRTPDGVQALFKKIGPSRNRT